jgi:hypothetical protein
LATPEGCSLDPFAQSRFQGNTLSQQIDPRGPRFGAAITTVVLAVSLVVAPSALATTLITIQTVVFALGAFIGLQAQPYGKIFAKFIRPRLSAPTELEDVAPPQFAQLVGFGFALVAWVALLAGATAVAQVAIGFALVAAFLNAAFGFCLGCEMYLIGKRIFS